MIRHIEVYASPWCPYCWQARLILRRNQIAFTRIPVRYYFGIKLPTASFRTMVERTGGDSTIPQIFVDGEYLGTEETLAQLERNGQLSERLSAAGE